MKEYSTLFRTAELESQPQTEFSAYKMDSNFKISPQFGIYNTWKYRANIDVLKIIEENHAVEHGWRSNAITAISPSTTLATTTQRLSSGSWT